MPIGTGDGPAVKDLELELKHFIVDSLILEDITAQEIDTDAPLFVEGLSLDSVDALELAMALSREYGVKIDPDNERNREIFSSVRSLAAFIAASKGTNRETA